MYDPLDSRHSRIECWCSGYINLEYGHFDARDARDVCFSKNASMMFKDLTLAWVIGVEIFDSAAALTLFVPVGCRHCSFS